jgi:hypothetical protein
MKEAPDHGDGVRLEGRDAIGHIDPLRSYTSWWTPFSTLPRIAFPALPCPGT